jgi:rubrerythrin
MQQAIIMDKLSEFLMVEQGGLDLYRVAAARSKTPTLKAKYEEFGRQTARHREVLVNLITELGGDPNYVSPTARLAQYKASKLLEASLQVDGLSAEEIEANDLENLLLAETKDHSDWHILSQLAESAPGAMKSALQAAVAEVEDEEDEHVEWARETLTAMCLQMVQQKQAPDPERWQTRISGPLPPIQTFHPAPFTDGLLEGSELPMWIETPISRSMATSAKPTK